MSRFSLGVALAVAASLGLALSAQTAASSYKGLTVRVAGVERSGNVSLSDCPPGANNQRGVIRPGDPMEFAVVKVDFAVTPAFKPGPMAKPTLQGDDGKIYNTAQAFGEIEATPAFTCAFAFRVPKGAKVTRFLIDTLAIDLGALGQ